MDEEREALEELKAMTPEQLDKVPADVFRWLCCVKGCDRSTKVKSFATMPIVYWRKRWIDLRRMVWYCGQHWKTHGSKKITLPRKDEDFKEGAGAWHVEPIWQPSAVRYDYATWCEFIRAKRERLPYDVND
jgi:hypothetical protein